MNKTNLELVEWCRSKLGVPYVYGTKMELLTKEKYNWLKNTYGSKMVWNSDASKIGEICCDCSGLISSFTGVLQGSAQMEATAKEVHPISTVDDAPIGVTLWHKGHVGVWVGDGEYIAEDGSAYGCRRNKLSNAKFTHWLKMHYIDYIEPIKPGRETVDVDTEITQPEAVEVPSKPTPRIYNLELTKINQDGKSVEEVKSILIEEENYVNLKQITKALSNYQLNYNADTKKITLIDV